MMSRMSAIGTIFTCILQSLVGCISYPDAGNEIRLELPSHSDTDFVIEYNGYTVLYDSSAHVPCWVAYELKEYEVVNAPPPFKGAFVTDTSVSVIQADGYDYRGSGWSRGHMAPAADFKWSKNAYNDTFYYTNCCPQNQEMNNGSWNVLENYVRKLAKKYGLVYVVTGPVVGNNRYGKIGAHQVVVPDGFFKALLIGFNGKHYAIGFYMENIPEKQHLQDCCMSINELENITGIDFFPSLSDDIESEVESETQDNIWF